MKETNKTPMKAIKNKEAENLDRPLNHDELLQFNTLLDILHAIQDPESKTEIIQSIPKNIQPPQDEEEAYIRSITLSEIPAFIITKDNRANSEKG